MDWSCLYKEVEMPDFSRMISRPDEWQILLAEKLQLAVKDGSMLEAGCGYGLTSLLVGESVRRTLLDLEPKAIEAAKALFATAQQHAEFVVGDILGMDFSDNCFDVVYNARVLEHFDFPGRRAALLEMVHVARPGGRIIVAVPNHYSVPYRYSYEYRKANGTWPYPDEEKIYDFSMELSGITNAVQLFREVIAAKTSLHFLSKTQKLWFKLLHWFKQYEGYITIITIEKLSGHTTAANNLSGKNVQ